MKTELTIIGILFVLFLCAAVPAFRREHILNMVRARMADFCLAPTTSKEVMVTHLLEHHNITRAEIDDDLYGRWINMRLALCRLRGFRSSPPPSAVQPESVCRGSPPPSPRHG